MYRRLFVPGGTYFFSVYLQDRSADTLVSHIDVLRQSVRITRQRWPFEIEAAVVLPNATHMIWTLPDGDADFSKRWRLIKSTFSRHVPAPPNVPPAHVRRAEKGIWQRRFWEHLIRDEQDFDRHLKLILEAPVSKGFGPRVEDWPFSSFTKRQDGREDIEPKGVDARALKSSLAALPS
jgi:putative transposase